ncbi:hypothetical protein [Streptomyces guryensis]|uniref:Uncharacterized protein n=1 Tax=Streptomyces guryensis TaxID=2886947 RepID=A0A9Q3Z639_9ACTN|nr:hypothetical protein [Streptomyces guryensis]MCD9875683.1 hypothetical protein [Streptomyces guryensis]
MSFLLDHRLRVAELDEAPRTGGPRASSATTSSRPSPVDPTDFGKFFTRHIGTCPGTFRHIHQGQ